MDQVKSLLVMMKINTVGDSAPCVYALKKKHKQMFVSVSFFFLFVVHSTNISFSL